MNKKLPTLPFETPATELDFEIMKHQLGRPMRGVYSIARRCICGAPAVVRTLPKLPDETPFPTSFYLTLPAMVEAASRLEAAGIMAEWSEELNLDAEAKESFEKAHETYLVRRAELGEVEQIDGISAGGMPNRVKCLHALIGHSLAEGEGVNLYGDRALALISNEVIISECACTVTPAELQTQLAQESQSAQESQLAQESQSAQESQLAQESQSAQEQP